MPQTAAGHQETLEGVRSYLLNGFLKSRRDRGLKDDEDLLLALNSLQLLRMVIELESRFHVTIDNSELTPENLGTPERIATFVEAKRAAPTTVPAK